MAELNGLKAIDTSYGGNLYRSRLEARWSLFLDRLSVRHLYEPEGFDLSDIPQVAVPLDGAAALYLPDFWLPAQRSWLEVKPTPPDATERERAARLAIGSGSPVYIVCGSPWIVAELPTGYDGGDSGYRFTPDGNEQPFYLLTACPTCGLVDWCPSGWADHLSCACPNAAQSVGDFARIQRAYLAARSARFEFGQTPSGGA